MKKVISILLCLLILCSLSVTAFATDIDKIETNNKTIIITDPPDVPVHRELQISPTWGTIIIIGGPISDEPVLEEEEEVAITDNAAVVEQTEESIVDNPQAIEEDEIKEIEHPLAQWIFDLTNEARVENGLQPLEYNFDLQDAADLRARECAQKFSHTRPNGQSCDTVVTVDYTTCGENLIQSDAAIAGARLYVDTWMNSPGHRANILSDKYTSIAIGVCDDSDVVYATQIFVG